MSQAKAEQTSLRICTDNNNWMPFIYFADSNFDNSNIKGVHIDIISASLDSLSYQYEFHPVPWKRCLKGLEKGFYDAVASASYNDKRSAYLYYPSDAATANRSQWRITQAEYIIATVNKPFDFQGVYEDIPKPIRIPRGFSIAQDLKNKNIEVDDSSINDFQNIKRLLRKGEGSVITLPSIIDRYNQSHQTHLIYQQTPLVSKSYYLAISKAGKLSLKQAQLIWEQISQARASALDKLSDNMLDQAHP